MRCLDASAQQFAAMLVEGVPGFSELADVEPLAVVVDADGELPVDEADLAGLESRSIDEVRVYNRALTATQIGTDMNTAIGGGGTGDTTVPTVSMTAPANGANVVGTVTVSATASDNVGVVGVQFLLDGVALGTEDTTGPYSIAWDSTTVSGGSHALSARARSNIPVIRSTAAALITGPTRTPGSIGSPTLNCLAMPTISATNSS